MSGVMQQVVLPGSHLCCTAASSVAVAGFVCASCLVSSGALCSSTPVRCGRHPGCLLAASCIQSVGHILLCPTLCMQLVVGRWPRMAPQLHRCYICLQHEWTWFAVWPSCTYHILFRVWTQAVVTECATVVVKLVACNHHPAIARPLSAAAEQPMMLSQKGVRLVGCRYGRGPPLGCQLHTASWTHPVVPNLLSAAGGWQVVQGCAGEPSETAL
jgi:hypothetical protein